MVSVRIILTQTHLLPLTQSQVVPTSVTAGRADAVLIGVETVRRKNPDTKMKRHSKTGKEEATRTAWVQNIE